MKKFGIILSFTICTFTAFSQNVDSVFISRMANEILVNGQAYYDLKILTKQIGGRLSGSPQMVKAEQWGLKTMKNIGPSSAWLQPCMVPHWVRGGKDAASAIYNSNGKGHARKLDVLALGNSIGSQKPVTASVIEIKNFDDLEEKKDLVKGKIVFYNYKFNPTFIKTFLSYGDAVKYRVQGPSLAAKYGAVAVIVRSMSHSTDNNPHTGSLKYDSAYKQIPALAIGLQGANWLSAQLKKGKVDVSLHTHGYFLPDNTGNNVIAELKGTEFPNEFITLGGHLDSWDAAEGAHDDGAGVVQTIEVLRTLKAVGYKPKHTIRFVLFANEENGLRGGTAYAGMAMAKKEKHIFALESDEGGFTPRGFSLTGTDKQFQKLLTWLPLLQPYGTFEIERGGGGADIGPLEKTQHTPVVGFMPDSQRYFDIHHSRNDVFENVNKRELELGAVNIAALIYLVDKYGF